MGKALLKQGRDAEAIGKFREALRLDPDNFQILAFIAHVLAADENPQIRDGKTALVLAAKANTLTGGAQPFVLDALGMACAEAGHFDDAQEAIKRAINLATAAGMKKDVVPMQQRLRALQEPSALAGIVPVHQRPARGPAQKLTSISVLAAREKSHTKNPMSRLRGRSQNRENQESCPEDSGAAFQHKHFGAAKARPRLIGLLLALVTLLVYLPAARDGFVNYDDQDYVTENSVVQKGLTWTGIKWAFTTGHASNWHPLTWLSHMADCELFGLNPGAHHLVNVLFHTANAVLLFVLLLAADRRIVAQRVRRRVVRVASAARGIRRLDFRTQGRVEHLFRAADAAGLHALCAKRDSDRCQVTERDSTFVTRHPPLRHASTGWPCFSSRSASCPNRCWSRCRL